MLKNKILTIFIALMLVSPVIAEEATGEALMPIAETMQENVQTVKEESPQLDTIPYKQPVSKKKMAKKFLMAMGGVAVSSILLFVFLTIYNKIRASILAPKNDQQS